MHYHGSRVSMASTYTIDLYGTDREMLPLVAEMAFNEVDRIDGLMSIYKRGSSVSFINRQAAKKPVVVGPELFEFLQRCLSFSHESEGAFDITILPLMRVWGFLDDEGRVPSVNELQKVLSRVGYQKLTLNSKQRTIEFEQDGMSLDLGGIAKGYAVDRVVSLLKEYQIERALVSAGGSTLFALGTPPREKAWRVKIRDPVSPRDPNKSALTVRLKNQSLSVAGSYEQSFTIEGVTYSHIMNPRTGRPIDGLLSVAVVTESGLEGDVLDNILFVKGLKESKSYLMRYPTVEAYFFLPVLKSDWRMVNLSSASK